MDAARIAELLAFHRDDVLVRTIPWWQSRMVDRDDGGYLFHRDRDGSLSSTVKGNLWKGPFHLPRMQLYCWKLLEEMAAEAAMPDAECQMPD